MQYKDNQNCSDDSNNNVDGSMVSGLRRRQKLKFLGWEIMWNWKSKEQLHTQKVESTHSF